MCLCDSFDWPISNKICGFYFPTKLFSGVDRTSGRVKDATILALVGL